MNRIQILIIKESKENFFNTESSIVNVMDSHDLCVVDRKRKSISFNKDDNSSVQVNYIIKAREVEGKSDRSFDVVLTFSRANDRQKNLISELVDILVLAFNKMGDDVKVTITWHSIFRSHALKAYEYIFDIENSIREFIYQLMAYKVGYSWIQIEVPDGVETRSKNEDADQSNFLHEIYLTDLTKILFEGKREPKFRSLHDIEMYVKRLKKEKVTSIQVSDLDGIISKSLWAKYFIDLDSKKATLEDKMKTLSKLRNDIAHNKFISRPDLGKVHNLHRSISKIIETASDRIDSIKFTEEDKSHAKNIVAKVNKKAIKFSEEGIMWQFLNDDRFRSFVPIEIDKGGMFFDGVFLDEMRGINVGVEIKRSVTRIDHAHQIVENMVRGAQQYNLNEMILVIASYTQISNLEDKLQQYISKKYSKDDINFRIVFMNKPMYYGGGEPIDLF